MRLRSSLDLHPPNSPPEHGNDIYNRPAHNARPAIVLLLLALVAAVSYWSLRHTSQTYATALDGRRTLLAPAIAAESEIRAANVEDLRYLLDGAASDLANKAARIAKARELIGGIIAASPKESVPPWRTVDSLYHCLVGLG